MPLQIAITGALGHIGSGFIHSVSPGEFDKVMLIDNFATQRYASLFNLPQNINFHFTEADILTTDLDQLFEGITTVIHLAAITHAEQSVDRADEVHAVNFEGTQKVMQACVNQNCKLIFPSTTSVYGTQETQVDETCQDLKPQSPYAATKLKCENELNKQPNLKFITCRLGTIFGPAIGMRFHTAVNRFIWQAVHHQPLTIWKTAYQQYRPYLGLTDAIAAIKWIINQDLFDQNIYNVVTQNYTVKEIVETIQTFVPNLKLDFVESQIMNQLSYHVSATKFKQTGFEFNSDLNQAIKQTLKLLNASPRT